MSSDSINELATGIARELNETNPGAIEQIQKLLEVTDENFVQSLLQQTKEIENAGGMLIEGDEERRRTPGGVFFILVKQQLTEEQRKIVFPSLPKKKKKIPIIIEPEAQLFAHQAVGKLKESDPEQKTIIAQIAQLGGVNLAKTALDTVLEMEEQEGLRRPDGTRRSSAEAFLYIASRRLTNEDRQRIWPTLPDELRPAKKKSASAPRGQGAQAKPRRTPFPAGAATTAKITLIGRPSDIFRGPGYIAFTLTSLRTPNLPRGLPTPPENTSYRIYVHERTWERVTENDLAEGIIIEGFPAFDPEDGIAVYAVIIKTRSGRPESSFHPKKGGRF